MCDSSLSRCIYSATSDQIQEHTVTYKRAEGKGRTYNDHKNINLCHGCPIAIFGAYVYCFID